MKNDKVLFCLKILKSILTTFVDSFFMLYFLQLSNRNIVPIGIYKLVAVITIFIVIFSVRNICKTKYRLNLLRIGIVLHFIYFLAIISLKEKMIDHIALIGILYGLEEGFYYSVYNMIESDGVTNRDRKKFMGMYTFVNAIVSILVPLVFGSYIYTNGFLSSLIIVLVIVIIRILLSSKLKDTNLPSKKKTDLRGYRILIKKHPVIKRMYKIDFYKGLTYSEGAFASIVIIYVTKIFSNSFSLGIFTSIFSMITGILGLAFAQYIKKEQYSSIIKISMSFTIVSFSIMIFFCNIYTVILFHFFQTFSKELVNLMNENSQLNLSNLKGLKKEYKVEYWLGSEFFLLLGRIVSYGIFLMLAMIENNYAMLLFAIILVLFGKNSSKLQKELASTDIENIAEEERS